MSLLLPIILALHGAHAEKLSAPDAGSDQLFGCALAGGGDLDGDGYQDLAISACGQDTQTGLVTLWPGGPAGLDPATVLTLEALTPATGAYFGLGLAGVGDVDGDGQADLVVGAPYADVGGELTLFLDPLSAPSDATLWTPTTPSLELGYALSAAGDLDGDGLADFVAGSPGDPTDEPYAGSVRIYLGDGDPDAIAGTRLAPGAPVENGRFGASVSGGGDLDGDGYADLAVGSPDRSASGVAAHVFYGGAAGVDAASEQRLEPAAGVTQTGFGRSVSLVGDLDGDGHADLVVGAPHVDVTYAKQGAVFVFFGGPSGADLATERQLSASTGDFADDFGDALAVIADHNGDGFDELLVGDPFADNGAGAAYLFYGGPAGPGLVEDSQHRADDARSGASFGSALADGVDLDGDGVGELVIGAQGDSKAGPYAGAVYTTWGVVDVDLDGEPAETDCDDGDPAVDDTLFTVYADDDGDGHGDPDASWEDCAGTPGTAAVAGDCDPQDPDTHPGAAEFESATSCRRDADGDGYGDADVPQDADLQPGSDCDDGDPDIWPTAPELRGDEVDSDCDGTEYCYSDQDGDGWSDGRAVWSSDLLCDALGETTDDQLGDCDDLDPAAWPDAPEVCGDGMDTDCDGTGGPSDDEDGDGLSWSREDRLGTSDCDTDSDLDGLDDGDEVAGGTDPARADTDGDGLLDGEDPEPLVPEVADSGRCSSTPGPAVLWPALLVAAGLLRRRRLG